MQRGNDVVGPLANSDPLLPFLARSTSFPIGRVFHLPPPAIVVHVKTALLVIRWLKKYYSPVPHVERETSTRPHRHRTRPLLDSNSSLAHEIPIPFNYRALRPTSTENKTKTAVTALVRFRASGMKITRIFFY